MSSLIPFSFESREIRVLNVNDDVWLVAKDVLSVLDYSESTISNLNDAIKHIPAEWKGRFPIPTPGGTQDMWCLSEPGLYFFLNRSDKPKALPLQKWVAGEVLPSIRKTGSYSAQPPKLTREERYRLGVYRDAVKTARMMGFNENMALLSADNYCKNTLGIGVLAHMGATHLIADQRGKVYTPTELGQLVNPPMSAVKFNLALEAAGLQRKEMGTWMPCDAAEGLFEWADTGKKHSLGTPVKQLRWFKDVLDRLPSEMVTTH